MVNKQYEAKGNTLVIDFDTYGKAIEYWMCTILWGDILLGQDLYNISLSSKMKSELE